MNNKKIYIAGHTGMVGSAITRKLKTEGFDNLIYKDFSELDLRNQELTKNYLKSEKPDVVIIAAAKVGGILANNTYRAEFLYDNLMIEANLIHGSHEAGVEKVIFLGSSCIYPKLAPQPLKEEYLLTDSLEYTNEPYAIAKIAGIKLCESYYKQYGSNFISAMPTNLFGPFDNFDLKSSHVLPALMRKFHEAKINGSESVEIWGSGKPKREFLHVDDLANALFFLMQNVDAEALYSKGISQINVGTGEDLAILDLAKLVQSVVGFDGEIKMDSSKPDGTPRKLMDVSRINELGWKHTISLEDGIKSTYEWFLNNIDTKNYRK